MTEELVIMRDRQAVTTSLQVAKVFNKNHRDVIRAIENKINSAQNCAQYQKMFVSSNYKDASGKANKMYYMNRDGFTFIAFGFTGAKADQFKLKYIDAFNQMEKQLQQQKPLAYTATDTRSGIISVYTHNYWGEDDANGWCFQLDPALKTVIVNKQWDKLDGMPVFCLRDLLNLITELEKTPVKERFPEKKYVLSAVRCAEGPVPVKQYVDAMNISTTNVEFHFGFANEIANAMEFTQKKLDSLSDFFPKAAIETMKEPVEDKDDDND